MPYASNKQAAWMHINRPDIAAKWHEEGHGYVKGGKNDPARKKRRRVSKKQGEIAGWLKPLGIGVAGGALANQFPSYEQREARRARRRAKKGQVSKLLVPISDDPFFNQAAAQKMFDLVMKMDDDTAEMFCHIVASDLLEQEVEKNRVALQKHLDEVIAKRLEQVKKATARAAAEDSEAALPFAQALALVEGEISKASDKDDDQLPNWAFERKIVRDPQSGRFRTKISNRPIGKKPLDPKTAVAMGIEGTNTQKYKAKGMTDERRARYQAQYLQVADFLRAVNAATDNNNDVFLHYKNDQTGETWTDKHPGGKPPHASMLEPDVRVIGAEAVPNALTAGGAAFSLAGAMGRPMSEQGVKSINAFDTGSAGWVNDWTKDYGAEQTNARLYGRTAVLGQMAGAVGAPGSKVQLAGRMADIVGQYGPQAEQVLGPTARKTAYRYRGTERAPDKRLVSAYAEAAEEGKKLGPIDRWQEQKEAKLRARRGAGPQPFGSETGVRGKGSRVQRGQGPATAPSLQQMVEERAARRGRAPEWKEREQGRAAVQNYLMEELPSKANYKLQLASGTTPPSEGVIINADGQLAVQAVGYGDDHYLPFNLKNLKALKGGEYIRNRSVGGLTSEDIYTGLISGARRVTVVSRSGTFTMEFQPDFRGGRRHNDKARRMTRRYEQLLDAVQSEQVERQDVPTKWKKIIETEVRGRYPSNASPRLVRAEIDREIKEFKANPQIDGRDLDRAEAEIKRMEDREARGEVPKGTTRDYREETMNELRDLKEIHFRLNGVGYAAALESLREQFPYYINTDSRPKQEHLTELEQDLGYVEPARNRPTAASAGWYGTAVRGKTAEQGRGGKFSAAHANYQRGMPGAPEPKGKPGKPVDTGGESSPSPGTTSTGIGTRSAHEVKRDKAIAALEENRSRATVKTAGVELQQAAKTHRPPGNEPPPVWWDYSRDQMGEYLDKKENLDKFTTYVQGLGDRWGETNAARQYNQFIGAVGQSGGGKEYAAAHAGTWQAAPYKFTNDDREAYRPGADQISVQIEKNRIDGEDASLKHNKPLGELTQRELRDEFDLSKDIRDAMNSSGVKGDDALDAFGGQMENPGSAYASRFFENPDAHLENIHRMRYLQSKAGWKTGGAGGAGAVGPGQPSPGGTAGGSAARPPAPTGGGHFEPVGGEVPDDEAELNRELAGDTRNIHNQYVKGAKDLAKVAQQQGGQTAMDAYEDYARKIDVLPTDMGMIPFMDLQAKFKEQHPQLHEMLDQHINRNSPSLA